MEKSKETIALFLTDLHIGSRWGLWHPDCEPRSKYHVTHVPAMNNVQITLWDNWVNFCKKLDKIKPDIIFLLGDIINGGTGHRNESVIELNEQCDCALALLRMIPRKARTSVLSLIGSTSYGQLYLELNQKICSDLGGQFYGTTGIFVFAGHSFRIYHGSTTAYIYLELVMGRRRTFAQEAIARKKLPEIEGIICGHSHRWLHMRTMWRDGKDFNVVLCPGWEGQTDFMIMKDPDKMIPEIGAVIGRFAKNSVDFQCIRYPTPLGISTPIVT